MVAEIIAVGTELLLGAVANTDAQMISQELAAHGIFVHHHTVVGDNAVRLGEALSVAQHRADIIITTGGLGPTYDDMTKQTVAAHFGLALTLHQPSLDRIHSFFEKLGRPCTPNNEQQAWLPDGCTILTNTCGTAPGCAFAKDGKHVILLPGPPKECHAMLVGGAMPYLQTLRGQALVSRFIRFFGIGESALEHQLRAQMQAAENPTIAPYANDGECYLRVTATAATNEEAFALTVPVVTAICEQFQAYVYGVDVDTLEAAVSARLHAQGQTLAVAESCTGGLIAKRMTDLSGASQVFWGGVATYSNDAKTTLLGVPPALIDTHHAVSAPVAESMATRLLALSGADYALSVTGLCGPEGQEGIEAGTVYIALATKTGQLLCKKLAVGTGRTRGRTLSSGHALMLLLTHM